MCIGKTGGKIMPTIILPPQISDLPTSIILAVSFHCIKKNISGDLNFRLFHQFSGNFRQRSSLSKISCASWDSCNSYPLKGVCTLDSYAFFYVLFCSLLPVLFIFQFYFLRYLYPFKVTPKLSKYSKH